MKNKYQKLNKTEKKKIKNKYYQTPGGKAMNNRLTRLLITGSMGIIFSFYLIYANMSQDGHNIWQYIMAGVLLLSSAIFITGSFIIRRKALNKFFIKSNK